MSDGNYDKINNHPMPLDYSGRALMHYYSSCFPTMHREAVHLTSPPHKIGISVLRISERDYITGLEFFFHDRPSARMGYRTPGARVMDEDPWNREASDSDR